MLNLHRLKRNGLKDPSIVSIPLREETETEIVIELKDKHKEGTEATTTTETKPTIS